MSCSTHGGREKSLENFSQITNWKVTDHLEGKTVRKWILKGMDQLQLAQNKSPVAGSCDTVMNLRGP
jgi:hypothetical protein